MINGCVSTILYSDNHCLAIKTTFELAATDPDIKALVKKDSDFTHNFVLNLIDKAIEQKEITTESDAETITNSITSAFTGWHESYIIHQDPIRIKKNGCLSDITAFKITSFKTSVPSLVRI